MNDKEELDRVFKDEQEKAKVRIALQEANAMRNDLLTFIRSAMHYTNLEIYPASTKEWVERYYEAARKDADYQEHITSGRTFEDYLDYWEWLREREQKMKARLESAEFWNKFVYPEGATAEQIQNELSDYHTFLNETAKVYGHVTHGRISKQNTIAEAVIAVADDCEAEDIAEAIEDALEEMNEFHPRAMKLIRKQKNFVVVAEDEPYFSTVYGMIRDHEIEKGRWTDEDEKQYQIAVEAWQKARES